MAAAATELHHLLLKSARLHVAISRAYSSVKRDPTARYFTYVLLLQKGRMYVGSSDNIYRRLLDHWTMSPSSAVWVREHGPVERVLEVSVNCGADDERYKTLEYMGLFGHDKVRGAGWCRVDASGPPAALADFVRDRSDFTYLSRTELDGVVSEVEALAREMAAGDS